MLNQTDNDREGPDGSSAEHAEHAEVEVDVETMAKEVGRCRCSARCCAIGSAAFVVVAGAVALIVVFVVLANRASDGASTVAAGGGRFFFSQAEGGVAVYNGTGSLLRIKTVADTEGINDVAFAAGVLYGMDFEGSNLVALDPDSLETLSFASPSQRTFSGVAAGSGRVVVSGGTRALSLFDADNIADGVAGTLDLGRGQPDAVMDPLRQIAFVSTDFSGDVGGNRFGMSFLDVAIANSPRLLAEVGITNDEGLLDASDDFAPNFLLRAAASESGLLAVAYLGGLDVFNVSAPEAPVRLLSASAQDLGFAPRDVAFDEDLEVLLVVGPQSRDNFGAANRLQALNQTDLAPLLAGSGLPVDAENGGAVTVNAVAAAGGVAALATDGLPIFVDLLALLS